MTDRGRRNREVRTGTGVVSLEAKGCRQQPEARREAWNEQDLRTSRGNQLCQQLDLRLPSPKPWENTFQLFSVAQPVVLCYNSPEANTAPFPSGPASITLSSWLPPLCWPFPSAWNAQTPELQMANLSTTFINKSQQSLPFPSELCFFHSI